MRAAKGRRLIDADWFCRDIIFFFPENFGIHDLSGEYARFDNDCLARLQPGKSPASPEDFFYGQIVEHGHVFPLYPDAIAICILVYFLASLSCNPLMRMGQAMVASHMTSANFPPWLGGTNLPQEMPSE